MTEITDSVEQDPEPAAAVCSAILVPADSARPCSRVEIPLATPGGAEPWSTLRRIIGGTLRATWFDRDIVTWIDDSTGGQPNIRATRYVWGHSHNAAQRHSDPDNPPYYLYGDAVFIGASHPDEQLMFDAPPRIAVHFRVE